MKKVIALILSLAMILSLSATAFAAEPEFTSKKIVPIGVSLSEDDKAFFDKLEQIFGYFEIDQSNGLILTISEDTLVSQYGFSSEDLEKMNAMFAFQKDVAQNFTSANKIVSGGQQKVSVSDWKVWFDNGDIHAFLFAAAQVGPAALTAALAALGSVASPGVGTIIGTFIGLWGAGTICYYVIQAVALGKGMYIGITWNGPFPNPDIGLW